MRTGTSTCTSRNGAQRIFRMYASRLIKSAARSNWLWTIARPDIGARVVRGGCSAALMASDWTQATACQAGAGMLRFAQRLDGIRRTLEAPAGARQHADYVGGQRRLSLGGILECQDQADPLVGKPPDDAGPRLVAGERPQCDDQWAGRRVERGRCDQRRFHPIRQIVAGRGLRAEQDP